MELLLTLEFTENIPVLNTLYRTNKFNKIYKSTKAKEFTEFIKTTFQQEELIDGDLKLDINLFISRDCDVDAKLKCLLDALQGTVFKNDSQIFELSVKKHLVIGKKNVRTNVEIYRI
jgi:Holliday junction resolvase RusA-like endonuclease